MNEKQGVLHGWKNCFLVGVFRYETDFRLPNGRNLSPDWFRGCKVYHGQFEQCLSQHIARFLRSAEHWLYTWSNALLPKAKGKSLWRNCCFIMAYCTGSARCFIHCLFFFLRKWEKSPCWSAQNFRSSFVRQSDRTKPLLQVIKYGYNLHTVFFFSAQFTAATGTYQAPSALHCAKKTLKKKGYKAYMTQLQMARVPSPPVLVSTPNIAGHIQRYTNIHAVERDAI